MTSEEEKSKREEMRQQDCLEKGKRPRILKGVESEDAGKMLISRGGAIYQVQKNGSMKRLSDEATVAIYAELAENPVEMECGAILHRFYCSICGCTRKESCRKQKRNGI
jgi:hypothetical protein